MTISLLGTLTILVLFFAGLATVGLAITGAHQRSERIVDASVQGIYAVATLATFASSLIVYAFVAGDYSIQYVQHTSDATMPLFFKITAIIWLGAGLAVWMLGRDAVHIGSSGLVFGYFGFLLAVAISERNVFDLGVASVVLFYYGGMFAGILPADALVSWEAHLAGFITGGLAARWLGPEWAAR